MIYKHYSGGSDEVIADTMYLFRFHSRFGLQSGVVIFDISKSKRADITERTLGDKKRCEEDFLFYGELDVKEAKIKCIFRVERGSK